MLVERFHEKRNDFLKEACSDLIKWCRPADQMVGRNRSDLYWRDNFSSPDYRFNEGDVGSFLKTFLLARWVRWDLARVRDSLSVYRESGMDSLDSRIEGLSKELGHLLVYARTGLPRPYAQQTSAATKFSNFIFPEEPVFIWDRLATTSARMRQHIRHSETVVRIECPRYFTNARKEHCYVSYSAACLAALKEEQIRPDFRAALEKARAELVSQGSNLAELDGKGGFLERRFLDKLMFHEGKWILSQPRKQ